MKKTRFAICGLSLRGVYHFALPILGKNQDSGTNFSNQAELVGILDIDRKRVEAFLGKVGVQIPYYPADAIGQMLKETRPDVLIVVGPDGTHCEHIVAGLEAGCEVIAEKPMVINAEQIRRVQAAEKKSGRAVRVAHNYRYVPRHKQLKRMILSGQLGRIINIEFTYNLDTFHGARYFYRWNSNREMAGALSISKGCHHFDLINWLLDDAPAEVFAFGGLNYYGANGALRPRDAHGQPLSPGDEKRNCPIFQKHYAGKFSPDSNEISTGWDDFKLPYDVQYPTEKRRYIYDETKVEDTYNAVVRYQRGTTMSYSCNCCTPWSGYILGINGTAGRIEITPHANPDPTGKTAPAAEIDLITFYPLFGGKQLIEVPPVSGGHGGADFVIRDDLILGTSAESKELQLVAGSQAGAYAIAIGEAMWRSIQEHRSISIPSLLTGEY